MRLDAPATNLKGIGPKAAALLARREIFTVGDLLRFYPTGYDEMSDPETAAETQTGSFCTLALTILGTGSLYRKGGRVIAHFEASDGTARVRLTFFNMPYLKQTLTAGSAFVFRGILRRTGSGSAYLDQPWFMEKARYSRIRGTLQPKYRALPGIGTERIRKLIASALEETGSLKEELPARFLSRYGLPERKAALRQIHFPTGKDQLLDARRRLIFDEFLNFILSVRRQRLSEGERANPRPMTAGEAASGADWCGQLLDHLPFALTREQDRAWQEIRRDLSGRLLMNRLVQGDVGSGKTILAFLALVMCAQNGRQGALMAPTEVLAGQHMESFAAYMRDSGIPVRAVLLTGSVKGSKRREILAAVADGTAQVVIGTHALFQEKVQFRDLGLVITDEQHRFGVRQRTGLAAKGEDVPVLVMSATPIPRTLAIVLYGDLQVSSLRALPPGRQPIKSLALQESQRGRAYRFILSEIEKGRQCYVICPAVEEGEGREIENVTDYTEKLRASLPGTLRIDSLTGRMRPEEKLGIMDRFSAGETDILVSTTVIEVGINVPNATVILIENAERFGLSQLHQLRGRVGRGRDQSYCIFLYSGKEKPERLSILEKNTNGFDIAEQDLKARGPGDLFGVRQSGLPQFALADLYEDSDLLRAAAECADELLREDPSYLPADARTVDYSTI